MLTTTSKSMVYFEIYGWESLFPLFLLIYILIKTHIHVFLPVLKPSIHILDSKYLNLKSIVF